MERELDAALRDLALLSEQVDAARAATEQMKRERDDYKVKYEVIVKQAGRFNAGLVQRLVQSRAECVALRAQLTAARDRHKAMEEDVGRCGIMVICECCRCEVSNWTGYICTDTKGWRDNEGRLFLCQQCIRFTLGEFGKELTKAELMDYVRRAREELRPEERCDRLEEEAG